MSIQDLINQATQNVDHTETTSTDFEYEPPAAGLTMGRFIEYIELGKQKQRPYQGKEKPDAEEVRLTFALTGPKNTKEVEVEGGTKKIQERISFNIAIKLGDKAKFKKIFNSMRYGRENITHMAQMLGDPFLIHVYHSENTETKKVYANLWDETGAIGIKAPRVDDPIAGTSTDIRDKIPAALDPLKVFFFNNPTKETWDSLFIDGTRTVKGENGKETEVSKNWLQEKILSATNFNGSPLDAMINNLGDLHKQAVEQTKAKTEEKKPDTNVTVDDEGGSLPDTGSTDKSADEALAALGLG